MKFLVLVNFKSYKEGVGRKGLKLAKVIAGFKTSKYRFAVAPSIVDFAGICKLRIPVFAQHVDAVKFGSHTGAVLPSVVKSVGGNGALLNHSEKQISLKEIGEGVKACKKAGLISVVCASGLGMIKKVLRFNPDYIAYEPRRLIGGNVSVVSINPKVISKAVKLVRNRLLVGAGVHSKKDVLKAEELGAAGVLIAHKIVKAKNVKKVLKRMFT
jgi:triosephosphate isomerase